MSDPFRCAPGCNRGPFSSAQATSRHRGSCVTWNTYVATQAQKRGFEEVGGEDEDPAITRRRQQKRKKLKKAETIPGNRVSSALPSPGIRVLPNSSTIDPTASSSTVTPLNIESQTDRQSLTDMMRSSPDVSPEPVHLPAPSPEELTAAGRPIRSTRGRLPARYHDILPRGTPAVVTSQIEDQERVEQQNSIPTTNLPRVILIVRDCLKTQLNRFGLWREYPDRPSYDPDGEVGIQDLSNLPCHDEQDDDEASKDSQDLEDSPLNPTQTLLMGWQNNGNSTKSNIEMDGLARIIQRPEFRVDELRGYNAQTANEKITKADENWERNRFKDSFTETSVEIEVPSGDAQIPPKKFTIPQLLYRDPLSVIRAAFADRLASQFHFTPFKLFQQVEDEEGNSFSQRVQTDLYNSDVFIEEHKNLRRAPTDDKDCKREKVVAALMCWSDATQLANFGTAKLWPIYMLFGNLSKYIRASPNSGAVHHLAYIPIIPDSVKHEISKFNVNWKTQAGELITHCNRELYNAIWRFLLNNEFLHAYKYGIVIKCFDGIERRVYPRFFTYSADYPEKVLLATIRELGTCLCPRCLCTKSAADMMGSRWDMKIRQKLRVFLHDKVALARKWIYHEGVKIRGSAVERILKATSSVPTSNAFVDRLGQNFNLARMLVVDLMHEFELGVWKALFGHLTRVVYAVGQQYVDELDNRFRQMPTFGFDTIRAFANNASEMKKLAARDFEDLLQCAIPVFEGLLPEPFNTKLMTLLYRAAEWHALAKLRMHTEKTLDYMESLTHDFGKRMRHFRDLTNKSFNTYETDRELTARLQRQQKKAASTSGTSHPQPNQGRRRKFLNLLTYKWHALADYVPTIRWFGPADSFSTQIGELAHRVVKKLYGLGNKKKDPRQIGRRLRRLEWAKRAFDRRGIHTKRRRQQGLLNPGNAAELLAVHHHIGKSDRNKHNIGSFSKLYQDDPAAKNFYPKLQDHLLGRLMERKFDGDTHESFTDTDRNHIRLKGGSFTSLKTCRINYTTYDVRRDQDTVNPSNHADVMMLSGEDTPNAHPYWYARILGIYRTTVISTHPKASTAQSGPVAFEFLWVRWLGLAPGHRSGSHVARLPKVGFVPESDPFAFGFLDPAHIIRGCHLMPAFSDGRTQELLESSQPTVARKAGEKDDWAYFYVGIFVDRDMFMRYFPGGGVGHVANRRFFQQSDSEDSNGSDSSGEDESNNSEEHSLDSNHSDDSFGSDGDGEDEDENDDDDSGDGGDDWQWDDGYGSP
ncbi:hypothetical protein F5879DRAFT_900027 [Lentinula edodes]|nr:hypothetical protein F5879DRAFT_900027 [Lentinula edodes]